MWSTIFALLKSIPGLISLLREVYSTIMQMIESTKKAERIAKATAALKKAREEGDTRDLEKFFDRNRPNLPVGDSQLPGATELDS